MTPTPKKMTQCQRIIQYIRDFGSITNRDASFDLGILNFGARISDLRRQGIHLTEEGFMLPGEKGKYQLSG